VFVSNRKAAPSGLLLLALPARLDFPFAPLPLSLFRMLRILIPVLLFLISLLAVLPAPQYHLWMGAILVTEFPWIFLLITLPVLIGAFFARTWRLVRVLFALAAFVLFASPVVRAWMMARWLPEDLAEHGMPLTGSFAAPAPFDPAAMIRGLGREKISRRTFEYYRDDSVRLNLDLYPGKPGMPCIIAIHGGSWQSGDRSDLWELNAMLQRQGYHVAAISYRMAPVHRSPAAVQDALRALQWLKTNGPDKGLDTGSFVLLGRSAGAQIALVAAYTAGDPSVKGVISFYGPADLVWGWTLPASPLIMDSRKVMSDYLGGPYEVVPGAYAAASATHVAGPGAPATLMIHGGNDPLVAYEHNLRLIRKLEAYKIPYYFLTLPWATHGCDYTLTGPSGQIISYTVERWLAAALGRK